MLASSSGVAPIHEILVSLSLHFIQTTALGAALVLATPGAVCSGEEAAAFERVLTENGFSTGTINAIFQDRRGFLWLGTATGLMRYDGYSFVRFLPDPSDSTSISGDFIWSICEDSSGGIWAGTQGRGLNRYDPRTHSFVQFRFLPSDPTGILGDEVTWVYVDPAGTPWAGSWNRGLNRYVSSTKSFRRYQVSDSSGLGSNNIHRIITDGTGTLWIGTSRGLFRSTDAKHFSGYHHSADTTSLPEDYVFSLYVDYQGRLWVGTGNGLCSYSRSNDAFTRYDEPFLTGSRVTAIGEDADSNLWAGTDGNGLVRRDRSTGSWTQFLHSPTDPSTITANAILSLQRDRTGILWIGTVATGLSKYDPHRHKFRHLKSVAETVNTFYEDRDTTLWIGTQNGMERITRENVHTTYRHDAQNPPTISGNTIYALAEDSAGSLWIGTWGAGITRFDVRHNRFTYLRNAEPAGPGTIGSNDVTSLFLDSKNRMWVGLSGGGIDRFDPPYTRHISYNSRDSTFPSDYVWAIHEDQAGNLWFGTWDQGVIRLNPTTGTREIFDPSHLRKDGSAISGRTVVSIAEHSGILWFGTWGDGLSRYDPVQDSFDHFSTAQGLPNNYIYGILIDGEKLWLTTGDGLAEFEPATGHCRTYDASDGVQSTEFRRGAAHRGPSGMCYVGGVNGYNMFNPGNVHPNPNVPPVVLTSVRVMDKEIGSLHTALDLEYNQNFVAFEFSSLDFSDPPRNRYSSVLEGLDDHWRESNRRYISYANLPPGRYRFRVRGSNNDNVWNMEGASIFLTIASPPWKTWWAFGIYAAVAIGIIVSWRSFEIRNIRRAEREEARIKEAQLRAEMAEMRARTAETLNELEKQMTRVQIARDLHDEIGGTLSSITYFAEALGDRAGDEEVHKRKFLSLISDSSAHAREAMSDIIWAIDPANDSWATVIAKLQRYSSDLMESRGISHSIEMPGLTTAVNIDPQRRRHFWMLFKEIVTNIAKHSGCTEATIRLTIHESTVHLMVSDNGTGFNQHESNTGHGLQNIRSRSDLLGATLELATSPGRGTTWSVTFRIS